MSRAMNHSMIIGSWYSGFCQAKTERVVDGMNEPTLSYEPPPLNIVIVWRSSFHTFLPPHARLAFTAACLKNAN